jgi:hypothetical protein
MTLQPSPLSISLPDTVFLPDRAALAMNALLGCLNPDKEYLPFCLTDLTGSPARMRHTQFDYSDHTSRVIDAILSVQALTGTDEGNEELDRLLPLFWKGFGEDGLHYTPDNPWSFRHANMHYQRSVLNALISLIKYRQDERAASQARKLVRGLHKVSIWRDGFAYFPAVEYMTDGWARGDWKILGYATDPANTNGRLIYGLVEVAQLLNDPVAAELAGGYVQHVMHHSSAFLPDGSFAVGMEFREGHFHSRALTLLGVIRYGVSLHDAAAVEWGRKVFERAKSYGTSFGWFPERVERSQAFGCETCAIVDMMEAAMWLGKGGHSQYWDDAERFLRNQLLESQLLDTGRLEESSEERGEDEWETTVDVVRRSVGAFAGWSMPNDFFAKYMHGWDLYTCCSAQGVRGFLNAWDEASERTDNGLKVNLLINKVDEEVTVRSWLPNEGRVEITPAEDTDVILRLPLWADRRFVSASIAGSAVSFSAVGTQHIRIAAVAANQAVEVTFPVAESTRTETVLDVVYTTQWCGDTVVDVQPAGSYLPLYRNRQPRSETPAVVKTFGAKATASNEL